MAAVPRGTYFPGFDWLRITLACCVMLAHANMFPWERLGSFRVQIFFALSGWLIGRILLRTPAAEVPKFYFGRVMRIWIPYALALILLVNISLLCDPITFKWIEIVLYKLTFVYNLFGPQQLATHAHEMPLQGAANHFWSICAEEQFYLFAPLLLVLMPGKLGRTPWTWAAMAACGIFSSISLGVAASLVCARWGALHLQPVARIGLIVILVSCTAAIWVNGAFFDYAVPVLALSIVLLLATPGPKSTIGVFLGGMSYQLYLNHWIGLFVAGSVAKRLGLDHDMTMVLFGFPLSISLSAFLYVVVDKHVMANRERWFTPRRAKIAMIAAYSTTGIGLLSAMSIELSR